MMDPEPARCRRTDGKKWRCSKEVLPNEKYCERHMHRGCRCSRKLVEASEIAATSGTTTHINLNIDADSNPKLKLKIQSAANMTIHESSINKSLKEAGDENGNHKANDVSAPNNTITKFVTRAATVTSNSYPDDNQNKGGKNRDKLSREMLGGRSNFENYKNVVIIVSSGLDFSPKRVLPGDPSHRNLDQINAIESEPGRCRRTDGKKWRCGKAVLPDQKYCGLHIHRGSKKRVLHSQHGRAAGSSSQVKTCLPLSKAKRADKCLALDTNLNIPAPSSLANEDKKAASNSGGGGGGGSTIEATITDGSTDVSALSP
ncbi:hypothetical protein Nepgr_033135 [Nepenthes gracilis]|uniref:Growth-regulating factor n=1 Tax=Nepenthes gracilis TaxID=150966 RepID=A0AAD3TM51_NEPGR|nr:hypothetical protein Nepgr_033135 [Nepenthes gracilis]